MKDKVLQFILERKWLLSIIIVLMIVVGILVFSVTTLSSQIQQGQQTETTGTSEFSFSYPTGVTEEETEKLLRLNPQTARLVRICRLIPKPLSLKQSLERS